MADFVADFFLADFCVCVPSMGTKKVYGTYSMYVVMLYLLIYGKHFFSFTRMQDASSEKKYYVLSRCIIECGKMLCINFFVGTLHYIDFFVGIFF